MRLSADGSIAEQLLPLLSSPDAEVSKSAKQTFAALKIDPTKLVSTEAAQTIAKMKTADVVAAITKREKSGTISLMPTGLVGNLTLVDFASLLDYLESLAREQDKK